MKRKILVFVSVIMMSCSLVNLFLPGQAVMAAGGGEKSCNDNGFLGMKPWYRDICSGTADEVVVKKPEGEAELMRFIWTIVLNILFDVLLMVGYIATVIVMYGGLQFMMAQGEPTKVAKAKKTLTTAAIGVVITMLSTVIVNTGTVVLSIDKKGGLVKNDVATVIGNALGWLYAAAGLVAAVYIVKGGVDYVISQGDTNKIKKATQSLIYSVVGLVVVILAAVITSFVTNTISGAL